MSERDGESSIGLAETMAPPSDGSTTATDPGSRPRAPTAEQDPLVGRRLVHFLIQRKLGEGGMGQVYLATDLALDRSVALKVMTGEIAARPGLRERFYREARAQARLLHPNVGHIYYIGEEQGHLFFAMEYIEGQTLQELLEAEGRLAPERAIELCRMAALGLREGCRLGFAHRDVKPSNLMIDRHGVVKVLDFGLVKEVSPSSTDLSLSQESAVMGTPLYLSPEQARGEAIDFRSDIYSLGVTLHHLVAGQPPFQAETPIATISRHLTEPRPRLALDGRHKRLRAGLDELCDRMMAKRRQERFDSYDDLLAALERLGAGRSRTAGFWVRAFAAMFDLMVVLFLSIPLSLLLMSDGLAIMLLAAPYTVLPLARWGKTLGKKVLQLEVTPSDRAGPLGWRQALLRTAVQLGPTYAFIGAAELVELAGTGTWARAIAVSLGVLAFAVPFILGITTAFMPDKRALWDRAAHTQVRYELK